MISHIYKVLKEQGTLLVERKWYSIWHMDGNIYLVKHPNCTTIYMMDEKQLVDFLVGKCTLNYDESEV